MSRASDASFNDSPRSRAAGEMPSEDPVLNPARGVEDSPVVDGPRPVEPPSSAGASEIPWPAGPAVSGDTYTPLGGSSGVRSSAGSAEDRLERCQRRLGYCFQDCSLLKAALTHASGAEHRLASNERLEFLGDAILRAVVCEHLFREYPDYLEGDLTKIKSVVVSRQTCAKISESLGLQHFMVMGKGMATSPTVPPSLLADVFESLLAAIFLDGGLEPAREVVNRFVVPEIELAAAGELGGNYKSLLQQLAQREFNSTPVYRLLDEKGPDHAKCFKVAAQVDGRRFEAAWGRNKKEAEQRAASNALAQLNDETPPYAAE